VTTSSIISKGTIVGVYLGVITMGDLNAYDDNIAYENGDISIYGARLTHATDAHAVVVDARVKGNIIRFINHDCKPNCEFVIWNMNDERALVVITLEPIPEYAQLTVNYGTADPTFLCLCGTCIHKRGSLDYRKPDKIKLKLNRSMDSVYLPSVFWNHQNKTSSLISVLMAFSTRAISSSVCDAFRSSKVSEIFHSLRDQ
jgi:SET domain-containing protein